ncbi:DRMBL-domain-containing protein [Acrodontium crateriforme]|uniref:DRMBL-domain-containing protein n=1 Tax=Acrodontium crateriforme TaxID=150365 RepID=A0AAQ3M3E6_9PEZI|nr:DRMBL-domain-containing protein [Acrodontium crateriforme]
MAVKSKAKPSKLASASHATRQSSMNGAKQATPKQVGKPNSSILSFFKKAEGSEQYDAGLFIQEKSSNGFSVSGAENLRSGLGEEEADVDNDERFNESESPVKRRKLSVEGENDRQSAQVHARKSGPFVEDSDSDEEDEKLVTEDSALTIPKTPSLAESVDRPSPLVESVHATIKTEESLPGLPVLIKEETSYGGDLEDFKDFNDAEDFDEDLFEDGDEFMERRYMEEQARLEAEESGPSCPICSVDLSGISEQDAGVHVNNCLDGNPTPLPETKKASPRAHTPNGDKVSSPNQFKKPVRAPRPAQPSPFTLGEPSTHGGSAFNKLMAGHAEDAAWAEAAASEHSSRGKPSYQRTCPFYKILPGMFICVDGFRYGAVQGCHAYFLSHFHSDHYIGLTSSWSHGPIYCSRATANLVRQQLRVDPKYVVDVEFDETFEVPGTKGVQCTMIPANHCPGSSLYLFEKTVGKKPNGESKVQRVLHCGDFRACRDHIKHPLLMPDVQDKLTGKTKEQKIDVCYLDTTYLNPKYAFPSQESVITACADMCVSLSKSSPDESDGWETMKRQRAGEGMVKFVQREAKVEETTEPSDGKDKDSMKIEKNPHTSQQILSTDNNSKRGRLLVVVGTYSIGKERICLGIAKALNSKIYAPTGKQRIVAALEDEELNSYMTTDPRAAQVHMTPLFEIRSDTLDDYLRDYFPHFTRAVGFRPSGWNYRPPNSRFLESPTVQTVLNGDNWKSNYSMKDLTPQRGSTSRASCFGVPYSEHSSFRELTMFCCALRIEKIIPTVNVGSAKSRERMKAWFERWTVDRRKNGLWKLPDDGSW